MSPRDPAVQASRVRARAPRREGQRRQVTVPAPLWNTLSRYAREHGTTPNDALIQLANAGAAGYERDRAVADRAEVARAAIMAGVGEMSRSGFLSSEEALEAALAVRRRD